MIAVLAFSYLYSSCTLCVDGRMSVSIELHDARYCLLFGRDVRRVVLDEHFNVIVPDLMRLAKALRLDHHPAKAFRHTVGIFVSLPKTLTSRIEVGRVCALSTTAWRQHHVLKSKLGVVLDLCLMLQEFKVGNPIKAAAGS